MRNRFICGPDTFAGYFARFNFRLSVFTFDLQCAHFSNNTARGKCEIGCSDTLYRWNRYFSGSSKNWELLTYSN
jgi:hypothetical protein